MPLPDVSRLLDLPAATWRRLGDRLFELEVPSVYPAVAAIGGDLFEPATRPLRCRVLRRRDRPVDRALRLFWLGDPITGDEARSALGDVPLEDLVRVGLILREGERFVSPFRLRATAPLLSRPGLDGSASGPGPQRDGARPTRSQAPAPTRGVVFFADALGHGGEAVMGAGPLTGPLLRASLPGGPIERALDLGCGAGLLALSLAPHARTVVASDINARALVLTRVNASLNGAENIELRTGDLFAPVRGERFDRVVCQPPFFPTPEGFQGPTFSHGGRRGDEIAMRAFAELPEHLSPTGRGVFIAELPEVADQPVAQRIRSVLPDVADLLVIESEGPDADAFCIGDTAFAHPDFGADYEREVSLQRDHLERLGVERLRVCLAAVQRGSRTSPGGPAPWTGTLEVRDVTDPSVDAALVDSLVAAHSLVHAGREALLASKLVIRQGTSFAAGDGDRVRVIFAAAGPLAEVQLDAGALRVVEGIDSARTVQAAAKRFAKESSGPRSVATERFLTAVEQMLLAGILEPSFQGAPGHEI